MAKPSSEVDTAVTESAAKTWPHAGGEIRLVILAACVVCSMLPKPAEAVDSEGSMKPAEENQSNTLLFSNTWQIFSQQNHFQGMKLDYFSYVTTAH